MGAGSHSMLNQLCPCNILLAHHLQQNPLPPKQAQMWMGNIAEPICNSNESHELFTWLRSSLAIQLLFRRLCRQWLPAFCWLIPILRRHLSSQQRPHFETFYRDLIPLDSSKSPFLCCSNSLILTSILCPISFQVYCPLCWSVCPNWL